jgi:hypothetical protein
MIRIAHGQRVELHYRPTLRSIAPHLATGRALLMGRGRGPRNALVLLDDGRKTIAPCGNLIEIKMEEPNV